MAASCDSLPCEPWNKLVVHDVDSGIKIPRAMAVAIRHKNVIRLEQWLEVCDDRYRALLLETIFELASGPVPVMMTAYTPAKDAPKFHPAEPWCAIVTYKDGEVPLAILDAFFARDTDLLLEYGKVCDRRYVGWISRRIRELGRESGGAAKVQGRASQAPEEDWLKHTSVYRSATATEALRKAAAEETQRKAATAKTSSGSGDYRWQRD